MKVQDKKSWSDIVNILQGDRYIVTFHIAVLFLVIVIGIFAG